MDDRLALPLPCVGCLCLLRVGHMSDSTKLVLVLAAIPVLIFSLFGFIGTFHAMDLEEMAPATTLAWRTVYGAALLGSLGLMAWSIVGGKGSRHSERRTPLVR